MIVVKWFIYACIICIICSTIKFFFHVSTGCQLEIQNIGATSSESSYVVGRPENKEDSAITKKIFQQEIINMKNAEKYNSRSSSSSRESSMGIEMSQANNNAVVINKQRQATDSPKKVASISNSPSSSSINSGRGISNDNQNSNNGSTTSIQNFLNKFNSKDKSPSPNSQTESKSFLGRLGEIKNSLSNHNNKVCNNINTSYDILYNISTFSKIIFRILTGRQLPLPKTSPIKNN